MPIIAESDRLIIQTWELEDIEALCELTRQEGLSEFSVSGYDSFSKERSEDWINKEVQRYQESRLGKFRIILKETGETIGVSGLFKNRDNPSEVDLSYRLPKKWRGQGLASEAATANIEYGFKDLSLKAIFANADINNKASHKVLERLGMSYVGPVEYEGFQAGRWVLQKSC